MEAEVSVDNGEFVHMNAATDLATANEYVGRIEEIESKRRGLRVPEARRQIARRIKASPGTLENIRRLRTKVVPSWLMARIRAEFVAILQNEIIRLEHEITIARQVGTHHSDDDLLSAEAQVVAAKEILRGAAQ